MYTRSGHRQKKMDRAVRGEIWRNLIKGGEWVSRSRGGSIPIRSVYASINNYVMSRVGENGIFISVGCGVRLL